MKKIFLIMIGTCWLFGANTVIDKNTNLEWQDNADTKNITRNWIDAKNYCENLVIEGKNDWRLPNIKELQSIIDIKRFRPAIKDNFKNVKPAIYWSSSVVVDNSNRFAWCVFISDGGTNDHKKSSSAYVRCVRDR